MSIHIKGTIAGLSVDLTIDGLDSAAVARLASAIAPHVSASADAPNADSTDNASQPPVAEAAQKAWSRAMSLITEQGEVTSFELSSQLSGEGYADSVIKTALLFLRERGEVDVARAADGQQRIYRRID